MIRVTHRRSTGHTDKTDSHDARAAAVVALRHRALRPVGVVAVLRLLARRHHDLTEARTRAVCRLHTTLCYLAEGHFPRRMRAAQAAGMRPRSGRPTPCRRS